MLLFHFVLCLHINSSIHPVNELITMGTALLIQAFKDRDPACSQYSWALLYLKVCSYDIHSRMLF